MTLLEETYKVGYLSVPTQIFLKKSWTKRLCALYEASQQGIQRLEIFESEAAYVRQTPIKIIPLSDCIKVSVATQKNQVNVFEIHTKSSVFTFSAESFQELSEWMSAVQKVAFSLSPSTTAAASGGHQIQNEENQVYSSLHSPEVYAVTAIETEASLRCSLKGEYLLVVNATSITLTEMAGRILYVWQYRHIRRYGCSKDVFSFEAGRKSPSGEGLFSFHAADGNLIFQTVDGLVNQLKTASAPADVPAKPPRRGKPSLCARPDHLYEDPQSVVSEPDYANLDEPQYGHLSTEPASRLYANVNNPVPHILHNDTEYAQVKKVAK